MDRGPGDEPWLVFVAHIAFATFASLIGFVMRKIEKKEALVFAHVIVECCGGAFVGALVFLLCQYAGIDGPLRGVVVGVCGWLGAAATIEALKKFVWRKLGVDNEGTR